MIFQNKHSNQIKSINIVRAIGVKWVGTVSAEGQPKSRLTFLSKFLPKQALEIFVKGKMLQSCGRGTIQYRLRQISKQIGPGTEFE